MYLQDHKKPSKKEYSKPTMVTLGNIEKLTEAGSSQNADAPGGSSDSAFPAL